MNYIEIHVCGHSVTGTRPRLLVYTVWLFTVTTAVVVTDTARLQSLKYLLSGPLQKTFVHPWPLPSYLEEEGNVPPAGHKVSAFHSSGFNSVSSSKKLQLVPGASPFPVWLDPPWRVQDWFGKCCGLVQIGRLF